MALPFPAPVGLKTLMSADKFRFTEGGFDLDLSYITERVIGKTFFVHVFLKVFFSNGIPN